MAIELKHATVATVDDAGNGEIGKTEWNEGHSLTGTADTLLGFDGSGDAEEVTRPAGDLVGTTATQTLSGKTLKDYKYTAVALTGTTPSISTANGTILTWTLTANSTPTDGLNNNEVVLLLVDDGSASTITWSMVDVWLTDDGSAPVLKTTGYTPILLYKIAGITYATRVGNA